MILPAVVMWATLVAAAPDRRTDKDFKVPSSPPPLVMLAKVDKTNGLMFQRTALVPVMREQEVTQQVQQNGKVVSLKRRVSIVTYQQQMQTFKLAEYRVFDTKSKEVDRKTLPRYLSDWTPVLYAEDGKAVDPFYLQIFKKDTLIIVPTIHQGKITAIPRDKAPLPPVPQRQPR